jgi:hypothetical protein
VIIGNVVEEGGKIRTETNTDGTAKTLFTTRTKIITAMKNTRSQLLLYISTL